MAFLQSLNLCFSIGLAFEPVPVSASLRQRFGQSERGPYGVDHVGGFGPTRFVLFAKQVEPIEQRVQFATEPPREARERHGAHVRALARRPRAVVVTELVGFPLEEIGIAKERE